MDGWKMNTRFLLGKMDEHGLFSGAFAVRFWEGNNKHVMGCVFGSRIYHVNWSTHFIKTTVPIGKVGLAMDTGGKAVLMN